MNVTLGWVAVVGIVWAAAHLNRKHRERYFGPEDTSALIQTSTYIGGRHLWDRKPSSRLASSSGRATPTQGEFSFGSSREACTDRGATPTTTSS